MAGTVSGGKKAAAKNLAKDPDYYKKIGSVGGKKGTTGGFYANRELAKVAGAKGGAISRRGPMTEEAKERMRLKREANRLTKEAMQYEDNDNTENENHGGGVRKVWERFIGK